MQKERDDCQFCARCGKMTQDTDRFCTACGNKLDSEGRTDRPPRYYWLIDPSGDWSYLGVVTAPTSIRK